MDNLKKQITWNITELTAIARVKSGWYPTDSLKKEIRELKGKESWLATQNVPGHVPAITWLKYLQEPGTTRRMSWLDHLQAVLAWAQDERQAAIRQMRTIHYARWVILNQPQVLGLDGPHLLFTSNFDGELEGYLTEFAEIDEGPLNLIFWHCDGWPGARPANLFINYVRKHQIPANLFYANYPYARVGEVNRALHWKQKTDAFIPKIMQALDCPSSHDWQKVVRAYLSELGTPTFKDTIYPDFSNGSAP